MPIDADLNDPALRRRAVQAARQEVPFDLLITGGTVLDLVTGEERAADIGIVGALIASVHAQGSSPKAETYEDATGKVLLPGLIDTHMHVESSMITPMEYAAHMVPRGVTTALWDPHELANVAGRAGMDYAFAAARAAALRFLPLVPTCVPSAPGFETSGADFDAETIAELLARPDTHGAAELMTMYPLLTGNQRAQDIVAAGLASGKRVCGHARGLSGRDLNAFVAAGVATDHELISGEDLIEKLRAGLTIELRGSHKHLLPEFVDALLNLGHMPQTVTLCTDDVFPNDLYERGGLDDLLRNLIALGLPPSWTYRAACLNAAISISRPDLGLLAPGRRADVLVLSDLKSVALESVFMDGKPVARKGAFSGEQKNVVLPVALTNTVRARKTVPRDFEILASGPQVDLPTLRKPRFPEWGQRRFDVAEGNVKIPPDILRMAVIQRHSPDAEIQNALLEDWGPLRGAVATSVSHDSHNLTIFGQTPEDMSIAANAVIDQQGGLAVASSGKLLARVPLPVAGLLNECSLSEIADYFVTWENALNEITEWRPPYFVLKALFGASLVCNPGPRLSDLGIVEPFLTAHE
ncbi:adenine deaminase [Dinoroseobacter sp. S375]|uniref:adenine deaminase n=1 Tax=Dinoroseobacter sp. S375 TaxID=3415136 RepID=UPI003C7CCE4E